LKELTEILTECRTSIVAAEDEESRWVMNLMNKLCQGTTYSKSENAAEDEESRWVMNLMNKLCQGTTYSKSENQEEKGTKEKKRQKYNRKYI